MATSRLSERPFELGAWRIEPAHSAIRPVSGGSEIHLEPQVMDLLLLFAGSSGQVLSKDHIVNVVWAGRAVGDDTVAAVVSRLRKILGQTNGHGYIETIPKRGYRLLVDVGAQAASPSSHATSEAERLIAKGEAALAVPFGLNQAQVYFEAAVAEAPGSAAAHAGLAAVLLARRFAGGDPSLVSAAKSAASCAVALDERHAPAWAHLGLATLIADRNFARADEAFGRAIAVDAGLTIAHRNRALAFATIGRFADAERASRRAVELEPVSLVAHAMLLQILICARRFRAAAAAARNAIALAPNASEAFYAKGWALVLAGEEADGVEALLQGIQLWGVGGETLAELRSNYDSGGFAALCAAGADLFEKPQLLFKPKITDVALLRAAAGDADRAFAALEVAVATDDPWLMLLPWLPHLDPIRSDARFERLLSRVRLVR
jgi:DNA-binding winged helix-turn-helix (wHTH) protein